MNKLIDLFPTPLYVVKNALTIEENDELVNYILSTQNDQVGRGKDVWDSGEGSPKNSFGLNLKDDKFKLILERSDFHTKQYFETLKVDLDVESIHKTWWWNVYDKTNYQEYHNHIPHLFSGVYYAKVPLGSSDIKFRHPLWNLFTPTKMSNLDYFSDSCNFKLYERIMIIFPSSLLHCVPSGKNSEPRISFSFNYGKL